MKKNILFGLTVLAAGTLLAADSNPKDDVTAAAKALGDAANYSWHITVEVPADSPFHPGPTDGKTEKDGFTMVKMNFNDNESQFIKKGTNAVVKTQDSGWQSAAEALAGGGGGGFNPTTFAARTAQNSRTPAVDVADLVKQTKELKATDKGITGDLTEDGAKTLLSFRGRRGGGGGPQISNAKGNVTFWIADGKLTKYQYHVTGTMNFNGNDNNVDRTTTVEVKDVGSTKIEVPDEAKKKLE
jgi:hypothetical protein